MINAEDKNIYRISDSRTIMESQNNNHSNHSMRKDSNLSMSNQSGGSTRSTQNTLRQYFMNSGSKKYASIDNTGNVSPSLVGGTPSDKDYTNLIDKIDTGISMVCETQSQVEGTPAYNDYINHTITQNKFSEDSGYISTVEGTQDDVVYSKTK
jgi:hypothetical protein